MKLFLRGLGITALLCTLISAIAFGAFVRNPEDVKLYSRWVKSNDSIDDESFQSMIALLQEDPSIQTLLNRVYEKAKVSTPGDLRSLLKVCYDLSPGVGGEFRPSPIESFTVPVGLGKRHSSWNSVVQDKIKTAYATQILEESTQIRIKIVQPSYVCIRPNISVAQAYQAISHELTHYLAYSPFPADDILNYDSLDDYMTKELHKTGGELDAYIVEGGVGTRLFARHGGHYSDALGAFFNSPTGSLRDLNGLIRFIQNDLHYGARFKQYFQYQLRSDYTYATMQQKWHRETLLPQTVAAQESARDYLESLKSYLEQLRAAKVADSTIQAVEGRIRDQETALAEYSEYVARIQGEIDRLTARVGKIRSKFGPNLQDAGL